MSQERHNYEPDNQHNRDPLITLTYLTGWTIMSTHNIIYSFFNGKYVSYCECCILGNVVVFKLCVSKVLHLSLVNQSSVYPTEAWVEHNKCGENGGYEIHKSS